MSESDAAAIAEARPLILLGRGGSGTRVLSEIARECGVFLGNEVSISGDSVEWVEVIYPLAVAALTSGPEPGAKTRIRSRAVEVLAVGGRARGSPWGWKLPETMLVLPEALKAFPRARVVHLVRHPVASSLRRTHLTSRMNNPVGRAALSAAYRFHDLDPARIEDDSYHVHNALSWNFQMARALDALETGPAGIEVLQLRFEDLARDQLAATEAVAAFAGLEAPRQLAHTLLDPERAAMREPGDEATVSRIWSICGPLATRLGYQLEPSE